MPSKKHQLLLYADECIPVTTVTYLKEKGISAMHAYDIGYVNKSDSLHFKKSKALGRILLSLDKDFRKFNNRSIHDHPGVILITTGNNTPKHINRIIEKVLEHCSAESLKHSIIRATVDRITKKKADKVTEV